MIKNQKNTLVTLLSALSMVLYIASMFPPVFSTGENSSVFSAGENCENYQGLIMLIIGTFSLVIGDIWSFLLWALNPLYVIGLFLMFRDRFFKMLGWMLLVLPMVGATFIIKPDICVNEAGSIHSITQLHVGYYLWEASFVVLAVATCVKYHRVFS